MNFKDAIIAWPYYQQ